mgnify:CR=1 FL=1
MSDIEAAFEEHFRYVYLYILKLSRDEALAEEITSESFLKALSSIDSFKGDCDIRVWLCQIAKNCYFTHRKKFQREYTLERPDTKLLIKDFQAFVLPFPVSWNKALRYLPCR